MAVPHCNENPISVFLFWELHAASVPISHYVSVSDLFIPRISLHLFLQQTKQTDRGNI
jgi:hypothetical protein